MPEIRIVGANANAAGQSSTLGPTGQAGVPHMPFGVDPWLNQGAPWTPSRILPHAPTMSALDAERMMRLQGAVMQPAGSYRTAFQPWLDPALGAQMPQTGYSSIRSAADVERTMRVQGTAMQPAGSYRTAFQPWLDPALGAQMPRTGYSPGGTPNFGSPAFGSSLSREFWPSPLTHLQLLQSIAANTGQSAQTEKDILRVEQRIAVSPMARAMATGAAIAPWSSVAARMSGVNTPPGGPPGAGGGPGARGAGGGGGGGGGGGRGGGGGGGPPGNDLPDDGDGGGATYGHVLRRGVGIAAGHSGLGVAGGLAGGLVGGFTAGGVAGGLAELGVLAAVAVLAPKQISSAIEEELLAYTDSPRKMYKGTQAMGRAGRTSGDALMRTMYSGDPTKIPELMAKFGLRPEQAMDIFEQYGIVPRDQRDAERTLETIGSTGLTTRQGFAGMPREFVTGMARQGTVMNLGSGVNLDMNDHSESSTVSVFLNQMDKIMTGAVSAGLDRSQVGTSMMTAFSFLAGRGVPQISTAGVGQVMGSFLFSDLPGGRTGQLGLSTVQGISESMSTAFQSPLKSVMAMSMVRAASTREDLAAVIGMPQANGDRKRAIEIGTQYLSGMEAKGQGDIISSYLTMAKQGNPAAFETLSEIVQGANSYAWPMFLQSQLQGVPLPPGMQTTVLKHLGGFPSVSSAGEFERQRRQGSLGQIPFDERKRAQGLTQRLMKDLGLSASDASALVGVMGPEAHLTSHQNEIKPLIPGSRGGYGIAQWTGPRRIALEKFASARGKDPGDYETQVLFLEQELQSEWGQGIRKSIASGSTLEEKSRRAFEFEAGNKMRPMPPDRAEYGQQLYERVLKEPGEGEASGPTELPSKLTEMMRTEAGVGQQTMGAKEEVWNAFGGWVEKVNIAAQDMAKFRDALVSATTWLRRFSQPKGPQAPYEPDGGSGATPT